MIVTATSQDLLKELDYLKRVMSSKPRLAILNNVLVQAAEDGLRLAATNLEMGLVTFCPAEVATPGAITFPAKHVSDILRLLPACNIRLELAEDGTIQLTADRYKAKVPTYPAASFPVMPSMRGLSKTALPANFKDGIKKVRFSITKKDHKHLVRGALLTNTQLVTTDGHRLALRIIDQYELEAPVVIPDRVLDVLVDMGDGEGETTLSVGERHLFFVTDGRMLFASRTESQFPNYDRVIPKDTTNTAVVPRQALHDAVQRVALTNEDVLLQFDPGVLTISGRSMEIGEAYEQVDMTYAHDPTSILLRGSYLLDFLDQASQETLTLSWKGRGPMLFLDGPSYMFVQMAMRPS